MTDQTQVSLQARYDIQVQEIAVLTQALARISASQDKMAALQRDLARAQAQIDAMRSSTSWKITRPLRAVVRAVRSARSPS